MIEFNLQGEQIKIRNVVPRKVAENGFVESILVDYCLEIPNMVDGEGNPTSVFLGAGGVIDVTEYRPEEFIPFNELSKNYFYELAEQQAEVFPEVLEMIDRAKLIKQGPPEPVQKDIGGYRFFKQ